MGEEHRSYHWGADQPTDQRLTVAQAAAALGITEGAVRSRIKRGTLPTSKEGGTVFVLLGGGTSQTNQAPNTSVPADQAPPELVEALRDQIRDLREQLGQANERDRENRRIIAALTSRIPELPPPPHEGEAPPPSEPPTDPREYAVTPTPQPGRVGPQTEVEAAQEPAEPPVTVANEQQGRGPVPDAGGPREAEATERVSWWRRVFGG
jgi:hypothetical protein